MVAYVDISFILGTEEEAYASRVVLIVRNGSALTNGAQTTHCLKYVELLRSFDLFHIFTNFEYWWKETILEQRFHVRHHEKFFVNWYCVDMFGIGTCDREEFFTPVPSSWSENERSGLLIAPTLLASAYHSTLALETERHILIVRIFLAENCVFVLLPIFTSALIEGPVEYFDVLEGTKALVKSVVLLRLSASVHAFLDDVGLF